MLPVQVLIPNYRYLKSESLISKKQHLEVPCNERHITGIVYSNAAAVNERHGGHFYVVSVEFPLPVRLIRF